MDNDNKPSAIADVDTVERERERECKRNDDIKDDTNKPLQM